jgi:CRP-like cAMP-binding protein
MEVKRMDAGQAGAPIVQGGWLGAMPRAARQRVLAMAQPSSRPAGTEIIREGERATRIGIVQRGRAALQLLIPERGRVTVQTAEPGDVFGLSAIVPPHLATMSVMALEDVELLMIDADALRAGFAEDCELSAAVYYAVAREMSRRLTATQEILLDLLASPATVF